MILIQSYPYEWCTVDILHCIIPWMMLHPPRESTEVRVSPGQSDVISTVVGGLGQAPQGAAWRVSGWGGSWGDRWLVTNQASFPMVNHNFCGKKKVVFEGYSASWPSIGQILAISWSISGMGWRSMCQREMTIPNGKSSKAGEIMAIMPNLCRNMPNVSCHVACFWSCDVINYWLVVWLPSIWHFPINIGLLSSSLNWLSLHHFPEGFSGPPTRSMFVSLILIEHRLNIDSQLPSFSRRNHWVRPIRAWRRRAPGATRRS